MTDLTMTLGDEEFKTEVRNALAGLDGSKVPDSTILQTSERYVVPLLNDITSGLDSSDQENFNSAVISWTAELSFGAWLTFTRLRDREVEAYVNPDAYKEDLQKRTNFALRLLGATRPPEIPNYHVTVKHDGTYRTVDLHKYWVYE